MDEKFFWKPFRWLWIQAGFFYEARVYDIRGFEIDEIDFSRRHPFLSIQFGKRNFLFQLGKRAPLFFVSKV